MNCPKKITVRGITVKCTNMVNQKLSSAPFIKIMVQVHKTNTQTRSAHSITTLNHGSNRVSQQNPLKELTLYRRCSASTRSHRLRHLSNDQLLPCLGKSIHSGWPNCRSQQTLNKNRNIINCLCHVNKRTYDHILQQVQKTSRSQYILPN